MMFTRGIFRRVSYAPDSPDGGFDILVAKIVFGSVKHADWFEDCAGRVCRYLYDHDHMVSDFYSVGNATNYHGLKVPLDYHVSIACDVIVPGAQSIDYNYLYSEDMVKIFAFVSAVQVLSVHDVHRDLDEIVSVVCGSYERTYGNGC